MRIKYQLGGGYEIETDTGLAPRGVLECMDFPLGNSGNAIGRLRSVGSSWESTTGLAHPRLFFAFATHPVRKVVSSFYMMDVRKSRRGCA